MIVEVCANSISSAQIAEQAGAKRIELCQNLMVGGTTPSPGSIEWCVQNLQLKTFVLIRPRPGDFCYSPLEIDLITRDISFCRSVGAAGVVVGALKPNGEIDKEACAKWKATAGEMAITFHRAFDYVPNPCTTLDSLIELGYDRVLTSGQKSSAYEGRALLAKLVQYANNRITILAGGGVKKDNVIPLISATQIGEIHLSAKALKKSIAQYISDLPLNNGDIPEHDYFETDLEKLREILKRVKEYKGSRII